MFKSDIFDFLEKLKIYWEKPFGLFTAILFSAIICFFLFTNSVPGYVIFSFTSLYFVLVITAIVIIWALTTNRVLTRDAHLISFTIIIEEEKKQPLVKKFFKHAIRKINSSKELKGLRIKLIPSGIFNAKEDLEKYKDRDSKIISLMWFYIISGEENKIESMVFKEISFRARFPDDQLFNLSKEIKIGMSGKDWKYISSEALTDNLKIITNLYELILYNIGIYLASNSKFKDAILVLKKIYSPQERNLIPIQNQNSPNTISFNVNARNIIAARLSELLLNCYIHISQKLLDEKKWKEGYSNSKEAEVSFSDLEKYYYLCIGLSVFSYKLGNLLESKTYTEKMKQLKGDNADEVLLNQGFYAIIANNIPEFIENYRRLGNATIQNHIAIIEFLNEEKPNYPNSQLLFSLAESIITKLYIDPVEGNLQIREIIESELEGQNDNDLKKLRFFAHSICRKRPQTIIVR